MFEDANEVNQKPKIILDVCKSSIDERQLRGKASPALYAYPPDLESSPILPSHLQDKIREISKFIYKDHVCISVNKFVSHVKEILL